MLLTPSWRGLMARNCGGQHQRRPGLSLMGLAAFTILIRSLSLKPTDWPLHLREPPLLRHDSPLTNIWPRGSGHTPPPGDLGQSAAHTGGGGFCSKVGLQFTYSSRFQPHRLLVLFVFLPHDFFFKSLSLKPCLSCFSLSVTAVYLALVTLCSPSLLI